MADHPGLSQVSSRMSFVSRLYKANCLSEIANAPPHPVELTGSSIQVQSHNNFDGLDKAFVLFKLPPKFLSNGKLGPMRLTRRVDLISAPKARYATAVLGWSGSEMFERDLR